MECARRELTLQLVNDKSLFKIMIESVEPESSFFQVFWSPATHAGEAIEAVLSVCDRLGITNPIARELDYVDFGSSFDEAVRDTQSNVRYDQNRFYFPFEKSFAAPPGIIESGEKGPHDYELIREGFRLRQTEADIYEVEAAIERDKLLETFIELTKRLPSIRVFWIKLAADWEDRGREEFWTNENLNTSEAITNFLTSHSSDTVANGYVALTVYSEVGQTNLSIDTHKTIKVLTKSAEIQRDMSDQLQKLGFEQLSEFHSLEYEYYHWHYRPTKSRSRIELIEVLQRNAFTLWREEVVETNNR